MGGRVLFRDSQGRDGQVDLDPNGIVYVGRGLDCAIRTDDAMVSRKHSQLRLENGRYVVEDLGSANGTVVNSARIQKQILNHNDVIQCGSLWLRYVEDGPLVPPAGRVRARGARGGVRARGRARGPASIPSRSRVSGATASAIT